MRTLRLIAPAAQGQRGCFLDLVTDAMPVMINPTVMVDPNPNADWTNMHSRSVNADASPNGANVSPHGRPAPAIATRVMYADATDDRARLGRNECDRSCHEAQSENYFFHMKTPQAPIRPTRLEHLQYERQPNNRPAAFTAA
jgi:hypothetical protein